MNKIFDEVGKRTGEIQSIGFLFSVCQVCIGFDIPCDSCLRELHRSYDKTVKSPK